MIASIASNVEFSISLLDCRFLAGNRELFARLHDKIIPRLVMREAQPMIQRLVEVTRSRHAKYGNTVFHLEPNVKDCPGGLRDFNVAHWLLVISAMDKLHAWPDVTIFCPQHLAGRLTARLSSSPRCAVFCTFAMAGMTMP